jgi:3',5'-cyclic AMP phosphodiesterase CpdA
MARTACALTLVAVGTVVSVGPPAAATDENVSMPTGTGRAAAAAADLTAGPIPGSDSDHKFAIAVMPDTQRELTRPEDRRLINRSNWLVRKKKGLDLRFVLHSGDVVNWDTPDHYMYANAVTGLRPVQANIPMALALGNHDTAAVCPGGSACPGADTSVTVRDTRTFNTYFDESRFGALAGQFEPGKVDNAYHTFRSGGRNWLVLNLELWPRTEVVSWARKVVAKNPRRNVIIVTHSYLNGDGTISRSNGGYGATSPRYLFDRLIKVYPNVKLVLSGHVGRARVRTDKGANGNKVVSMLQAMHDTSNPVRLIWIDTAAGTFRTRIYDPDRHRTLTEYSKKISKIKFVR